MRTAGRRLRFGAGLATGDLDGRPRHGSGDLFLRKATTRATVPGLGHHVPGRLKTGGESAGACRRILQRTAVFGYTSIAETCPATPCPRSCSAAKSSPGVSAGLRRCAAPASDRWAQRCVGDHRPFGKAAAACRGAMNDAHAFGQSVVLGDIDRRVRGPGRGVPGENKDRGQVTVIHGVVALGDSRHLPVRQNTKLPGKARRVRLGRRRPSLATPRARQVWSARPDGRCARRGQRYPDLPGRARGPARRWLLSTTVATSWSKAPGPPRRRAVRARPRSLIGTCLGRQLAFRSRAQEALRVRGGRPWSFETVRR